MSISLELVDFTQQIPAKGWCRMPQQQHVGRQIEPEQLQPPHAAAVESAMGRGDVHLAIGGITRMRPREAAGPFVSD